MSEDETPIQPRPIWSGVIAFGLVSLPVSLFSANRGQRVALKMVDTQGTPLKRYYFCEREKKPLTRDEIVRGYAVGRDRYLIVKDRELESLAPKKSQEIDLRRFVSLSDINPVYFQRAYFLVPDEGTNKAYRLLAKSMEEAGRAGIATFVMRGKEYLVSIIAERGILRAETLRFVDEVRSPADVGLPELEKPANADKSAFERTLKKMTRKRLDRTALSDQHIERLRKYVSKKLKNHEDVIKADEQPDVEEDEESNVIDIMQVLKERLAGQPEQGRGDKPSAKRRAKPGQSAKKKAADKLNELTKAELYQRAIDEHIEGRSKLSKQQLVAALRQK